MSAPTIDLNQIADDVTAILSERAQSARASEQEAEREAIERAQRESVEATTARRKERQDLVARLEVAQRNCHDRCVVLETQYRELPDRIVAERRQLNVLLSQLNDARKGL
jgi:hypothetical protein